MLHYQYVGWPDFGTPTSATSFIGFIQRVRSEHRQDGPPMVVHCSSGVGRSGVFIILDCMLERLKEKDTVNVCECFSDTKRQRLLAVETLVCVVCRSSVPCVDPVVCRSSVPCVDPVVCRSSVPCVGPVVCRSSVPCVGPVCPV